MRLFEFEKSQVQPLLRLLDFLTASDGETDFYCPDWMNQMKIDNNFPALANLKASRRRLENVAGRMGFCVGDGVASNADDGEYLGRIESMFLNRRNRLMLVVDGVTYGAVDCCIAPSPEEIAIRAREARELFNKRSIDRLEVVSGQLDSDHIDCWDEAGKYDE